MTFLMRFWPHLLIAGAVIVAGVWINRLGYESGHAASEAYWRSAFERAREELVAANERTRQRDIASKALTQKAEVEHAQTLASLQVRAADADKRIRALSVRLATVSSNRCQLPEVSGPAPGVAGTAGSSERAERAGASISDTGRRCERDAATLADLQRWVRDQRLILSQEK